MSLEHWIHRKRSAAARVRLFCFPFAGGSTALYSRWLDDFPPDVEVCAVELPGRRARLREPPFRRMEALVEATAQGLAPYLDLPFLFFGHSMGALIAFELTRHLRRLGRPVPEALFVSAAAAPHLHGTRRPLWRLSDADFLEAIRRYGGTPPELFAEPDLMALFLPILRADFELFDTYVHEDDGPLTCPVHVRGGEADAHVSRPVLLAWGEVGPGLASVDLFPGGHFYLTEQRAALTASIARELGGVG